MPDTQRSGLLVRERDDVREYCTLSAVQSRSVTGLLRVFWVSTPMLRLGCLPLDLYAACIHALVRGVRWLDRQKAAAA